MADQDRAVSCCGSEATTDLGGASVRLFNTPEDVPSLALAATTADGSVSYSNSAPEIWMRSPGSAGARGFLAIYLGAIARVKIVENATPACFDNQCVRLETCFSSS